LPLLDQADNYRARAAISRDAAADATRDTSHAIAQHLPPIVDEQINAMPNEEPLERELDVTIVATTRSEQVELDLEHAHRRWLVSVELLNDPAREAWYELANNQTDGSTTRVQIRINFGHPFMERFISPDGDEIIPFTRLAAGLAIAELTAREVGVRQAGTVRANLNQILRTALSGPIQKREIRNG